MEDLSGLCFSCMGELDEYGKCPHCEGKELPPQDFPLLTLGTVINERYYIGKVIKTNGEGSTYVAFDTKLSRPCTLREFFPSAVAERDYDGITVIPIEGSKAVYDTCREEFLKLWTKLMRLKGLSALISVYEVFKANETVYAVYSESEEISLRSYLLGNGTGYISWDQARILFMPILSTIVTLHTSGVIHKGITPSSLLITPDGRLKLSGFCTSEVNTAFGELEADISDGYAPIEVYSDNRELGAWTDIYSITAVLFRTLVGSTPIAAPVRAQNDQMMIPAKFAEQIPPYVINAIINGMQIEPEDRTRNAEQLRSNLSASPRAIGASAAIFTANSLNLNAQRVNERTGQQTVRVPSPPRVQANPYIDKPAVTKEAVPQSDALTPERITRARDAEEQANKQNNTRKRLTVILAIFLGLLLIGIGLVVSEIVNSSAPGDDSGQNVTVQSQQQSNTVQVPYFVGQQYDTVTTDTYYTTLFTFATVTKADNTAPRGQIIEQSIAPSTTVTKGTTITLTVSTGTETLVIPDVTGLSYEAAYAQLTAKGFVCVKSSKYNDGTHTADTVAETVPEAKTQAKTGDKVYVVMWSSLDDGTTVQSAVTTDAAVQSTETNQDVTPVQPTEQSQTAVTSNP